MPMQRVVHVGHLNSFLGVGDGNLTAKNRQIQIQGRLPGEGRVLRLQIDRCITRPFVVELALREVSCYGPGSFILSRPR